MPNEDQAAAREAAHRAACAERRLSIIVVAVNAAALAALVIGLAVTR